MHLAQKLAVRLKLQVVFDEAKAAVPQHQLTKLAAQKVATRKLSRNEDDRKHHALYPGRSGKKPTAAMIAKQAGEAAVEALQEEQRDAEDAGDSFHPAKPHGGVKRTYRGMGNLVRNTKSGGLRKPRKDN